MLQQASMICVFSSLVNIRQDCVYFKIPTDIDGFFEWKECEVFPDYEEDKLH